MILSLDDGLLFLEDGIFVDLSGVWYAESDHFLRYGTRKVVTFHAWYAESCNFLCTIHKSQKVMAQHNKKSAK